MSLTPVGEMSNAQLVAESDQIGALIREYRASDKYISDSLLVRGDDLMYQIMDRTLIVERYEEAVRQKEKYGWDISDGILEDYENLVAKYGDPAPLLG